MNILMIFQVTDLDIFLQKMWHVERYEIMNYWLEMQLLINYLY